MKLRKEVYVLKDTEMSNYILGVYESKYTMLRELRESIFNDFSEIGVCKMTAINNGIITFHDKDDFPIFNYHFKTIELNKLL